MNGFFCFAICDYNSSRCMFQTLPAWSVGYGVKYCVHGLEYGPRPQALGCTLAFLQLHRDSVVIHIPSQPPDLFFGILRQPPDMTCCSTSININTPLSTVADSDHFHSFVYPIVYVFMCIAGSENMLRPVMLLLSLSMCIGVF